MDFTNVLTKIYKKYTLYYMNFLIIIKIEKSIIGIPYDESDSSFFFLIESVKIGKRN